MATVSVIKLIRTDTTLDLSQEAEKVCWFSQCPKIRSIPNQLSNLWAILPIAEYIPKSFFKAVSPYPVLRGSRGSLLSVCVCA